MLSEAFGTKNPEGANIRTVRERFTATSGEKPRGVLLNVIHIVGPMEDSSTKEKLAALQLQGNHPKDWETACSLANIAGPILSLERKIVNPNVIQRVA